MFRSMCSGLWSPLVGISAAVAALLTGADRGTLALVVAVAASCYVAAAALSRPAWAWVWVPVGVVVAVGGGLCGVSPPLSVGVVGVALLVVGVLRGASRPILVRQAAGLVVFVGAAVVSAALGSRMGLVLAAVALTAHGAWDLWHLRRHRGVVSPSLARFCVALDVPLGLGVLALAIL